MSEYQSEEQRYCQGEFCSELSARLDPAAALTPGQRKDAEKVLKQWGCSKPVANVSGFLRSSSHHEGGQEE